MEVRRKPVAQEKQKPAWSMFAYQRTRTRNYVFALLNQTKTIQDWVLEAIERELGRQERQAIEK